MSEEEKPKCKLVGADGNVFNIIGLVKQALQRAGQGDRAKEFAQRAMTAKSYGEVLNMTHEYVKVS